MFVSYQEMRGPRWTLLLLGPPSGQHYVESSLRGGVPKCLKICAKIRFLSKSRCVAGTHTHTHTHRHISIRTSRLEDRRAGRCILRRRDSRCVVSERHRAGVLGLGCPMHGELARPASPHEVGEGALTAVCPPAGPNLPAAQ